MIDTESLAQTMVVQFLHAYKLAMCLLATRTLTKAELT